MIKKVIPLLFYIFISGCGEISGFPEPVESCEFKFAIQLYEYQPFTVHFNDILVLSGETEKLDKATDLTFLTKFEAGVPAKATITIGRKKHSGSIFNCEKSGVIVKKGRRGIEWRESRSFYFD